MGVASQQASRERELELLRVGAAYARAIGSYYEDSPGARKTYPTELSQLLEDPRFVGTRRHLRQLYEDPVTRSRDWEVLRRPDGTIEGVRSRSERQPARTGQVEASGVRVGPAQRYSDWLFVYTPAPAANSL